MAAAKGNKYAAKAKQWTMAIERALEKKSKAEQRDALEAIADVLVQQALDGDREARREIGDRLEGKAHQTSEVMVTRSVSLRDLPTDELANIALGRGEGVAEASVSDTTDRAVH